MEGEGGCLMVTVVQIFKIKKVLEISVTAMNIRNTTELYT